MQKEEFAATRKRLALTQQALADTLGVKIRAVQRWEAGDRSIPGPVIKLLALLEFEGNRFFLKKLP